MKKFTSLTTALFILFIGSATLAQQAQVGREAAGKYFQPSAEGVRAPAAVGPDEHYLAIHAGKFMDGTAWEWGQHAREDNTGNYTVGLTYQIKKYTNNMDLDLRVEMDEYSIMGDKPYKLSFVPMIIFPEASSHFPLYFGAGVGAGVFFKQIKDESYLSLDYQLILGARFFDVYENTGFFIETGLKNHLLITTNGQFNGVFLSGGAVFTF